VPLVVVTACGGGSSSARSTTPTTQHRSTATSEATTSSSTVPATTFAPTPSSTVSASTEPPTTAGAIDTDIEVYGDCTSPSVEPAEIVLACADYGEVLEGLDWTSWTATKATAIGILVYNDCVPDCAEGHQHSLTGDQVTLTNPVRGAGGRIVWSEAQLVPEIPSYATGPYHGSPLPLDTQPD
jgi:hypothetical protein